MTSQNQQQLSERTQSNLNEIELYVVTSSQYFKPKPGTTYVIEIDLDKHRIKPTENPKFTDAQGKPLKRYELVVTHPNNQKDQIWTVSKTDVQQIVEEIRKGFKFFEIERIGEDRSTIYKIKGVQ